MNINDINETNWLQLQSKDRILEPYKEYFWDFYNPLKPEVKEKAKRLRKNYYETRQNKGRQ